MCVFCFELVNRLSHTHANTSKLTSEHIQAVEEEDDDGQYAQNKEEYIEDLKELEQVGAFRFCAYHFFSHLLLLTRIVILITPT